jgi:hypothetical protein
LRLHNPHTTDGIDQPRRISREEGEQMVEAGTAVRRFDTFNHHSGYNLCAEAPRSEQTPLAPSSCVFSRGEIEAIAFQIFDDGRSFTATLSEPQKLERVAQKRRPEDYVELAAAKIEQWPRPIEKTTPDKAVRVYPKV